MHDWMKTVRSPTRYRVGDNRFNFHFRHSIKLALMTVSGLFGLCLIYFLLSSNNNIKPKSPLDDTSSSGADSGPSLSKTLLKVIYEAYNDGASKSYNTKYPLSPVITNKESKTRTYKLLAVADLDTSSKSKSDSSVFLSYLLSGKLVINDDLKQAELEFDPEPTEISTEYSFGGRGMELSELAVFNGKLYSCDDRTGIVYEVLLTDPHRPRVVPWVILVDGDGRNTSKGFKCEWMAVKDHKLYVGGLGKEWTTSKGVLVNHNPQWIKIIGHLGDIAHVDWTEKYNALRAKGGYLFPGYMIFESANWSPTDHKWYFLPRRASREAYDEKEDEKRATNLMLKADEDFTTVDYHTIGEIVPVRGYSSFKFVPGTDNRLIVALKSEEDDGHTRTYVTLFDVNGFILVKDKLISDKLKYEGIEFV